MVKCTVALWVKSLICYIDEKSISNCACWTCQAALAGAGWIGRQTTSSCVGVERSRNLLATQRGERHGGKRTRIWVLKCPLIVETKSLRPLMLINISSLGGRNEWWLSRAEGDWRRTTHQPQMAANEEEARGRLGEGREQGQANVPLTKEEESFLILSRGKKRK